MMKTPEVLNGNNIRILNLLKTFSLNAFVIRALYHTAPVCPNFKFQSFGVFYFVIMFSLFVMLNITMGQNFAALYSGKSQV